MPTWTIDRVWECAHKCHSCKEFRNNYHRGYDYARKMGIYPQVRDFLMVDHYKHPKYTKQELLDLCYKAGGVHKLREYKKTAYKSLCNQGYYAEFTKLFHENRFFWNEDLVIEEAKKYKTYSDFQKYNQPAYNYARKNYLLDKIKTFFPPTIKSNLKKRVVYVFEFSDGAAYVGLTCHPEIRLKQHVAGKYLKENSQSAVYKYIKSHSCTYTFKVLTPFLSAKKAANEERFYILLYSAKGFNMLNKRGGRNRFPFFRL